MGLETAGLIGLGAGAIGAIAGATKGAQGTPGQTQTQQTTFAPATEEERNLQQQSLQQYLAQINQANAYEQGIGNAQVLQDRSRQNITDILGGGAFQMTPDEQRNIQNLRTAMISQGSDDVNRMLDQRLQQLNASAAARGVRGQAQMQLQGDALRAAATEQGNLVQQANQMAAQQAINTPYQRIQAMNPFIMNTMGMADAMRLQAQQNRQLAQNPIMLQLLNQERLRSGTTTQYTPGQEGSWQDALLGGIGGFGTGAKTATDIYKGFRSLDKGTGTTTNSGADI